MHASYQIWTWAPSLGWFAVSELVLLVNVRSLQKKASHLHYKLTWMDQTRLYLSERWHGYHILLHKISKGWDTRYESLLVSGCLLPERLVFWGWMEKCRHFISWNIVGNGKASKLIHQVSSDCLCDPFTTHCCFTGNNVLQTSKNKFCLLLF